MNNHEELIGRGQELTKELAGILRQLSDREVLDLLGKGSLNELLNAIFDPSDKSNYPNLQEFLLANRGRALLVALLRYAITQNYSFDGVSQDGKSGFVSPSYIQWFPDGVMFLQGKERFAGLIGLYRDDKTLHYAIAAKDIVGPGEYGPEYFEFVSEDEYEQRLAQISQKAVADLDAPINQLEQLLKANNNVESKYQELFMSNPWVLFGAKYSAVQRHTILDNKNIPDFTGVRLHDNCRDIFEIKPPFTKMFHKDGTPNNNFHEAWSQAERYLDFTKRFADYLLRQKDLRFENPKCYLVLGYNLSEEEIEQVRIKERMNPSIELLTYNQLWVYMKGTINFIRNLQGQAGIVTGSDVHNSPEKT